MWTLLVPRLDAGSTDSAVTGGYRLAPPGGLHRGSDALRKQILASGAVVAPGQSQHPHPEPMQNVKLQHGVSAVCCGTAQHFIQSINGL